MIAEVFAHHHSVTLGVQMTASVGIGTFQFIDLRLLSSNLGPQRPGLLEIAIDGDVYEIPFTLTEETIDQRTVQGYVKKFNTEK